jgi:CP family cyanate transporter-like MFS transporter
LRGDDVRERWWPDWGNKQMLLCGCILGCAASLYFTSNAFLPDFLHATERGDLVDKALIALNGGQLPASFLLLAFADKLVGKSWPLAAIGLVSLAAVSALALSEGDMAAIVLSGVIGFCAASVLILVLALPPLLAQPEDVHHFSAGVFAIGYTIAFLTPIISGALWDTTHTAATAFIPVAASGAVLAALAGILHISPNEG